MSGSEMLRRFEIYSLSDTAPPEELDRLRASCRDCGRFIPEVLHSGIGTNVAGGPLELVWEAAFASPEAYQRYMIHPFHACVLDRYLLKDCAERVVSDNRLGAGLIGYHCDGPVFDFGGPVRGLVLFDLDPAVDAGDLAATITGEAAPRLAGSVFAANTMARAWFDGVTPIVPPSRWSHIWEQGFSSLEEALGFEWSSPVVRDSIRLVYEIIRPER
jgi:hypothetical protein